MIVLHLTHYWVTCKNELFWWLSDDYFTLYYLLDALEQSDCNPELAIILVKSLLRCLQHSTKKIVLFFKILAALPWTLRRSELPVFKYRSLKGMAQTNSFGETTTNGLAYCQNYEMSRFKRYNVYKLYIWLILGRRFQKSYAQLCSCS